MAEGGEGEQGQPRLVAEPAATPAASMAISASISALGISVTAVSATSTVRPRASTSETPIRRWPGLVSMQCRTSPSATEKLRVTPVTMASTSPSATMQAAKWLRSW